MTEDDKREPTTRGVIGRPFRRVLVANRGEIALRVIRGAREQGFETVAVASDADLDAPFALAADQCVHIGSAPAAESYLSFERVLGAAEESGAEAIHPGYGFLAENADFAQAVIDAGLVWIGPSPDAIRTLGDKVSAKEIARAAKVPVAPSYEGAMDDLDAVAAEAERIGFPLLVKAAAGGGGRGMRVVQGPDELADALEAASREAVAAFGSGRVFLEKFVHPARHVEIQIIADELGHVLHLRERECSVQRRHQKIVEEAPSPVVDPLLRARMGEAAVALAQAAKYTGAGTVEFLVGPDKRFYFLEVNTRLQVEHPVTELITGTDLVALQLRVAQGLPLTLSQDQIHADGHAIELRVCAEDPAFRFAPQSGPIEWLELPTGPGIRVDCGVRAGYSIPQEYDSLILKLLAHGPDRDAAITRARKALDDLVILGPVTNVPYLRAILDHPRFRSGDVSIAFLAEQMGDWSPPTETDDAVVLAAALGVALAGGSGGGGGESSVPSPWATVGPWRQAGGEA